MIHEDTRDDTPPVERLQKKSHPAHTVSPSHMPYRWVVVAASFILISMIYGIRFNFGVFFDVLVRTEALQWDRGDAAAGYAINMVVFTLSGTLVGWLLDRLGTRTVFAVGLLIFASGIAMTSQMTTLHQFYLYYGVWAGLGMSFHGLGGYAAAISRWFDKQEGRGLAIGLAFAGTGVGVQILAPLSERLITFYGWSHAFLLLAACLAVLGVPLVLLLREGPLSQRRPRTEHRRPASASEQGEQNGQDEQGEQGQPWTWGRAVQTPAFWLLLASGICSFFTLRMITVHQVAYLVDSGVSRQTAASITGTAGLVTALAFVVSGSLSDRIGREVTFAIGSLAQVGAIAVLLALPAHAPLAILYAYALLWGAGEGSRSNLLSAVASDLFAGPSLATIIGSLVSLFAVGAAFGSWWGGAVYDQSGSYTFALVVGLAATLVATVCLFLARHWQPRTHAALLQATPFPDTIQDGSNNDTK